MCLPSLMDTSSGAGIIEVHLDYHLITTTIYEVITIVPSIFSEEFEKLAKYQISYN